MDFIQRHPNGSVLMVRPSGIDREHVTEKEGSERYHLTLSGIRKVLSTYS